jgi:hypothetical protein
MSSEFDSSTLLSRASQLIDLAKKAGADAADAVVVRSRSQSVSVRLGKVEERNRPKATISRCASSSASASPASRPIRASTCRCLPSAPSPWPRSRRKIPSPAWRTPTSWRILSGPATSRHHRSLLRAAARCSPWPPKPPASPFGRHQFLRRRCIFGHGRHGAGHLAWLRGQLHGLALRPLRQRHRRRGHRHGARL